MLTFEIHLPGVRGLKAKRQVVRRVKDRLRSRYNVAVSEMNEHGDLWQRASVAVVSVSESRDALAGLFDGALREAETLVPGTLIETGTEYIEGADGGPAGWSGDWE